MRIAQYSNSISPHFNENKNWYLRIWMCVSFSLSLCVCVCVRVLTRKRWTAIEIGVMSRNNVFEVFKRANNNVQPLLTDVICYARECYAMDSMKAIVCMVRQTLLFLEWRSNIAVWLDDNERNGFSRIFKFISHTSSLIGHFFWKWLSK